MTVLVTGATGSVGRLVVAGLLAAGQPVRGLTRDAAKADMPRGVEVVTADLADPATLTPQLFDGVDRMLVFPAACGVADLMNAAVVAGIEQYVVLSSLAAALEHPRDTGSASALHHRGIEDSVTSRTDGWAIVRPGMFANNLLSWAYKIKTGVPIRAPYLQSAQAPVHEADVADAMLALLHDFDRHRGSAVAITGPQALTRREQATVIGEAVRSKVDLIEITPDQFRHEASQFIPEAIITMLLNHWHDTLTQPDKVRPIRAMCGHDGRTLAEWARDHRDDFAATAD